MKALLTLASLVAISLTTLADDISKDCADAGGEMKENQCIFQMKVMKGDEVIRLIDKAINKNTSSDGVIEGNSEKCVAKWHSVSKMNWSEDKAQPIYGELIFVNSDPDRVYKFPHWRAGQKMPVGRPLNRFWIGKDYKYETQQEDLGVNAGEGADFYVVTTVRVSGMDKYELVVNQAGDMAFGVSLKLNGQNSIISADEYCEIEF